jgi:NAD+ kinase
VSTVVVVAHRDRAEAALLAAEASQWLTARGHTVWMPSDDAHAIGLVDLAAARDVGGTDLALSLGGDGTVLRTIELVARAGVPILAVNVGQLGYLTEVEPPGLTHALERFLAGEHELEPRMMLAVEVRRAASASALPPVAGEPFWALNEAVIEKSEPGHTVRLLAQIDGSNFTTYAADGLIVATPTGSTAYSLSARGPIISPRHRAVLVTPVSPHMLFDRSLVLDPEEAVEVRLLGHRPAVLSVDGRRVAALAEGDTVACCPAGRDAFFVRFGRRHFHQILKTKFGLSDR